MTEARISPHLITWARERARLTSEEAAAAVKIKDQFLRSWENGETFPSFPQAQKLAHTFHVPFGFLFLSNPPDEELPLPDLRTTREAGSVPLDANSKDLLNSVLRKQQWYRTYLEENGAAQIAFLGRFDLKSDVAEVASDIRKVLSIDASLRRRASGWSHYLTMLAHGAGAIGILTLRSGIVGSNTRRKLAVDAFRGFAITDPLAPVVFINSSDSKAAQVFTFGHEMAHIWIGQAGISNLDPDHVTSTQGLEIEMVCNRIAAEVLMPSDEFWKDWRAAHIPEEELQELARRYWVSTAAILKRAWELNLISETSFFQLLRREQEKQVSAMGGSKGGSFAKNFQARNTERLIGAIVSSVLEGRTLYREASVLLDVKVETVRALTETWGLRKQ